MRKENRLRWELSLQPLHTEPDTLAAAVGAIVNMVEASHWVALRVVGGRIWLLDSLAAGPQELTVAAYRALIARHPWTYAIWVL